MNAIHMLISHGHYLTPRRAKSSSRGIVIVIKLSCSAKNIFKLVDSFYVILTDAVSGLDCLLAHMGARLWHA